MTNTFKYGGFIAAAVLIVFGVVAIFMGFDGRSTVQSSLKLEAITGSEGMNPATIATEAKEAGLPTTIVAADVQRRRQADRERSRRPLLRELHPRPRARGQRWQDLLAAAAVRDGGRCRHE